MQTTLQDKNRLIVWKAPRTISRLTHSTYIPKRGEIIVLTSEGIPILQGHQIVKRVIELPGDHIIIKDGITTIYNEQNPLGFQPDRLGNWRDSIQDTPQDTDTIV